MVNHPSARQNPVSKPLTSGFGKLRRALGRSTGLAALAASAILCFGLVGQANTGLVAPLNVVQSQDLALIQSSLSAPPVAQQPELMLESVSTEAISTNELLETVELSASEERTPPQSPLTLLPADEPVAKPSTRVIWMEVTAYCPCSSCCGPNARGITASGKRVSYNGGKFVAADTRVVPMGTRLSIPGYHSGKSVPVLDRGGAIKGNKLDVYFPSHQTAKKWGRRLIPVTIHEEAADQLASR